MEEILSIVVYVILALAVIIVKKNKKSPASGKQVSQPVRSSESSAMPHKHAEPGVYESYNKASSRNDSGAMPHKHEAPGSYTTFNKKSSRNDSGTMPHKHEKANFTPLPDVATLPKGFILLNGEPVRVADLENK